MGKLQPFRNLLRGEVLGQLCSFLSRP
jgi:hypothetical protein